MHNEFISSEIVEPGSPVKTYTSRITLQKADAHRNYPRHFLLRDIRRPSKTESLIVDVQFHVQMKKKAIYAPFMLRRVQTTHCLNCVYIFFENSTVIVFNGKSV